MRYSLVVSVVLLSLPELASAQGTGAAPKQLPKLKTLDPKTPDGLRNLFKYAGEPPRFVAAHRGGPRKGFPENCVTTFENTLRHTPAMMEIDPRYTKDGSIVLHHDPTLERTTNGKGRVSDWTLQDLKKLKLKDPEGNLTKYFMPTLDEALEWARGRTVLVLDRKGISMADRVRKVEEHKAEAYAMLMAYTFEDAKTCHRLNQKIMMEVFIKNRTELEKFERTGVPWRNVVVFVGHSPPKDPGLCKLIHAKGALCMAGTSRNLDRQVIEKKVSSISALDKQYRALMAQGVDLIETDIPVELGQLLFGRRD